MKRFSFVFAFMAFALFALSQSNYVYVEEAGTLDSLLNAFSLKDATQLTVEGKLNGSDIKTIRYMLGGRYLASQEEHGGKLESLDLTNATIVAGGEAYLFMETSSKPEARLFTSNDTVGEMMFWDCVNLKEIKLPLNITVIDGGVITNAKISFSNGGKVEIKNGGKLVMRTGVNFVAPTGVMVDIKNGNILRFCDFQ